MNNNKTLWTKKKLKDCPDGRSAPIFFFIGSACFSPLRPYPKTSMATRPWFTLHCRAHSFKKRVHQEERDRKKKHIYKYNRRRRGVSVSRVTPTTRGPYTRYVIAGRPTFVGRRPLGILDIQYFVLLSSLLLLSYVVVVVIRCMYIAR